MPPDVTCPVCRHRLPAECGPVCPRCGAELPWTEVRPAAGDIQATPPAPLPTVRCPNCGKAVPELCLLCPHCEEPIEERHRVHRRRGEEDVEGAYRTKALLTLGAVVGGACLVWVLAILTKAMLSDGPPPRVAVARGLFVATLLAAGLFFGVYLPSKLRPTVRERGSIRSAVLVEALGGLGCLALVVLAVATFIIVVCGVG